MSNTTSSEGKLNGIFKVADDVKPTDLIIRVRERLGLLEALIGEADNIEDDVQSPASMRISGLLFQAMEVAAECRFLMSEYSERQHAS